MEKRAPPTPRRLGAGPDGMLELHEQARIVSAPDAVPARCAPDPFLSSRRCVGFEEREDGPGSRPFAAGSPLVIQANHSDDVQEWLTRDGARGMAHEGWRTSESSPATTVRREARGKTGWRELHAMACMHDRDTVRKAPGRMVTRVHLIACSRYAVTRTDVKACS